MVSKEDLPDIQNQKGDFGRPVHAGVTRLNRPIKLLVKGSEEIQTTVAQITLTVNLPADRRGVNMSRLPLTLNKVNWTQHVAHTIGEILLGTLGATKSTSAEVSLAFPYFYEKESPATNHTGISHVECMIAGSKHREAVTQPYTTELMVHVPVMTLCPCSKEISDEGAHNQRATVQIRVFYQSNHMVWIEDLIRTAEEAASSPVYPIVKRPDEKAITEQAYNNPKFVEDVARGVADTLDEVDQILKYEVQVISEESIHQHDAIAIVEG